MPTESKTVYIPNPGPVVIGRKNILLALVLAAVFGPLGMLYSTVWGAIIMLVVSGGLAFITLGISLFFTWPVCIVWAWISAANHNARLAAAGRFNSG